MGMLDVEEEEVPPFDPKKVALFGALLGLIAFAGWRFWRAQQAVAAVAEASKDYRKLFPAHSMEAPPPAPKPVETAAPVSGIGMLRIDDDMRAQRPVPAPPAPAAAPPSAPEAPPPVVEAPVVGASRKPAPRAFNQPRLNSGAFSGLNGGSGVTFSGAGTTGGGAKAPPDAAAIEAAKAAAAAAAK